jgi:hypothetical protein
LKGPGYTLELACLGWGKKFPSVAPMAVGATLEGCGGDALTYCAASITPSNSHILCRWSNVGWATNIDTQQSTSGYLFHQATLTLHASFPSKVKSNQ